MYSSTGLRRSCVAAVVLGQLPYPLYRWYQGVPPSSCVTWTLESKTTTTIVECVAHYIYQMQNNIHMAPISKNRVSKSKNCSQKFVCLAVYVHIICSLFVVLWKVLKALEHHHELLARPLHIRHRKTVSFSRTPSCFATSHERFHSYNLHAHHNATQLNKTDRIKFRHIILKRALLFAGVTQQSVHYPHVKAGHGRARFNNFCAERELLVVGFQQQGTQF